MQTNMTNIHSNVKQRKHSFNLSLISFLASHISAASLFILLPLTLSSCDDFLTELPETAIPEEEAMLTLSDAEKVCLGVYSTFKNPALYSGSLVQATEVQSDLFYAAIGYTNQLGSFYRWETNANDPVLQEVYGGLYQIVNRCNFFFDHRAEVEATLKNDTERDQMKKYVADVAFMRAYAYHDLVRLFCKAYDPVTASSTLGVPIYLKYREEKGENVIIERSTLDKCYEQILCDLDTAAVNEPRKGTDTPFVTQGAIAALRARVLLYMHDWEGAEKYATEVIDAKTGNTTIYELADANYECINPGGAQTNEYEMMLEYDTADEIIWKISFSSTDFTGSIGSLFMGVNSGRYNPSYLPANWLLESYPDYDYRYTTHFPIVTTVQGVKWEILTKFPGNPIIDGVAGPYFCNMPKLLRLGETYLIRAEARCMLGKTTKACEDITTLRRARIRNYGSFMAEQSKLLHEIQNERARELVGEGFRLTDLKRWGIGFERIPQTGTIDGPNYNALKVAAGNSRYTWLIPQHEITASKGIVIQNE